MPSTNCPSREELGRFAVGNLDARAFATIATHVEQCRDCEAALQALDAATDPLITALRQPVTTDGEAVPPELITLAQSALHSAPRQEWLAGPLPRRVGKFNLLEELGSGSFGTVFRAFDMELEREVAVKILRRPPGGCRGCRALPPRSAQRRAAQAPRHRLALRGRPDRRRRLLTSSRSWFEAITLAERLAAGPFDPRDAARLVAEIGRGTRRGTPPRRRPSRREALEHHPRRRRAGRTSPTSGSPSAKPTTRP